MSNGFGLQQPQNQAFIPAVSNVQSTPGVATMPTMVVPSISSDPNILQSFASPNDSRTSSPHSSPNSKFGRTNGVPSSFVPGFRTPSMTPDQSPTESDSPTTRVSHAQSQSHMQLVNQPFFYYSAPGTATRVCCWSAPIAPSNTCPLVTAFPSAFTCERYPPNIASAPRTTSSSSPFPSFPSFDARPSSEQCIADNTQELLSWLSQRQGNRKNAHTSAFALSLTRIQVLHDIRVANIAPFNVSQVVDYLRDAVHIILIRRPEYALAGLLTSSQELDIGIHYQV